MTNERDDAWTERTDVPPDMPGEKRYRNSAYFLQDRLRCSEALADLRSVQDFLEPLRNWDILKAERVHALQAVPIRVSR